MWPILKLGKNKKNIFAYKIYMVERKHVNSLLINRTVNGLMIPFYKKRSSKIFLGTLGFKKPNTALSLYQFLMVDPVVQMFKGGSDLNHLDMELFERQ